MESDRRHGSEANPLISLMRRLGVPVNRKTYLDLAHMGRPPIKLSQEHEEEMPPHMRKHHKHHDAK